MPDYYAILWRALRKGDFQSERWRESVFEQTRRMLRDQLRNARPPMSAEEVAYHTDALEAGIATIRDELAQDSAAPDSTAPSPPQRPRPSVGRAPAITEIGGMRPAAGTPRSLVTPVSIVLAVVAAAAAAGGYAYFASRHDTAPPPPQIASKAIPPPPATRTMEAPPAKAPSPPPAANKAEAAKETAPPSLKRPKSQHKAATPDGDLPPGVDGTSTDADVAFFLRRQPVF